MIKRTAILAILLTALMSENSQAQWKMLFHYPTGFVNKVIYFLDLPGPPKIGFVGNDDFGLIKTTDGGQTWNPKYSLGQALTWPDDIVFKDSSNGWEIGDGIVYTTTDCGETWTLVLPIAGNSSYQSFAGFDDGIYYDSMNDGLFISGQFPVTSWDEGAIWNNIFLTSTSGFTDGFAFNNGDTGILSSPGGSYDWYLTKDGGHTWSLTSFDSGSWQPLAIPETTTQFAITNYYATILRSDDFWSTWDSLYQFPYKPDHFGLASSGCIRGDTSHLFVQTVDGCFMSTDQGHSWQYLCGMPSPLIGATRFYVKYPYVYLQVLDQIWMLNVDSMQYFTSSIAGYFPNGTKRTSVNAGSLVTMNYLPQTDTLVGFDSVHFSIHYDSASLSLNHLNIPSGWSILDSNSKNGVLNLWLTDTTAAPLPTPILQLTFNTYLGSNSAKVYLDSANLFGQRLNCDCAALSLSGPDSVEIDFQGCADSLILAAMQGQPPFSIESIQPNPASDVVEIGFINPLSSSISYQVMDVLGTVRAEGEISGDKLQLDIHSLTSGLYYLRARNVETGGAVSGKFVIER
jgi:hypothetical protein